MFKFFKKLSAETSKTGRKLFHSLGSIFHAKRIDGNTIGAIERALHSADFGIKTTQDIVEEIKAAHKRDSSACGEDALKIASRAVRTSLEHAEAELPPMNGKPQVICLIGTNGSGKTTTAAKLAQFYKANGHSVLLASCDTFRAAAHEQIQAWAQRLSIDIIGGQSGGDAAAIAYDAYQSALAKKRDALIIDTAGRLHVKSNLMAELGKISRILHKLDGNVQLNNWLVVDGSIGSNSIESAKIFHGEIGLHGIIVTKLDGSSRGGTIVGIHRELNLPILFIGTGESPDDLVRFSVDDYAHALFASE
jgi:fused signal recognition particle receptor